jgi:hypothetical protein
MTDPVEQRDPEPLRIDKEANPVYPEWNESWSVPTEPPEQVGLYRSPEQIRTEVKIEQIRTEVKTGWDEFRRRAIAQNFNEDSLTDGAEKSYSTSQVAAFFGRSPQWVYWGLRPDKETGEQVFTYRDGSPILPDRVGPMGKRRFTLPLIREIALSHKRRGNLTEEELMEIMAKILLAEFGPQAFADTRK